jgi:hypothetical protein
LIRSQWRELIIKNKNQQLYRRLPRLIELLADQYSDIDPDTELGNSIC